MITQIVTEEGSIEIALALEIYSEDLINETEAICFRHSSRNRFDRSYLPIRTRIRDRRPPWNNENPWTNPPLRGMSFIGCGSSRHTLADRKCTPSVEKIKINLMNRNIPAKQAEEMAQFHASRITLSRRYTQTPDNQHNNYSLNAEDMTSQPVLLKRGTTNTLSHVRHFNMLNEHHEMEK